MRPPPKAIQLLTMPGLFALVLAGCGFAIVVANLLGLPRATQMLFPQVVDLPALMSSTLLLLVIGMTPLAIRMLRTPTPKSDQDPPDTVR